MDQYLPIALGLVKIVFKEVSLIEPTQMIFLFGDNIRYESLVMYHYDRLNLLLQGACSKELFG